MPLACVPRADACEWVNWFGGAPRPYPAASLTVDNNWPATSFEEWAALVKASITP